MMERDLGFGGKFPRACVGKKSCCPISPYRNTVRFSKGCILLCSLTGVVMLDDLTLRTHWTGFCYSALLCFMRVGERCLSTISTYQSLHYSPLDMNHVAIQQLLKKNCCNSRINRFDYSLSIFPSEDIGFPLCLSIKIKFLSSPSPTHRSLS